MCNSVRPHPAVPVSRYQVLTLHIQSVGNTPQLHSFVLGSHIIPFHLTDQGLLLYTLTGGGGRWSNAETSRCPCNSECPTLPLWLILVSCLSSLDTTWYIVIHRHSPHSLAWQNCIFTITHLMNLFPLNHHIPSSKKCSQLFPPSSQRPPTAPIQTHRSYGGGLRLTEDP